MNDDEKRKLFALIDSVRQSMPQEEADDHNEVLRQLIRRHYSKDFSFCGIAAYAEIVNLVRTVCATEPDRVVSFTPRRR